MDNSSRLDSSSGTTLSLSSFVPDHLGGWICPHCMMTPNHLRAPGYYSQYPPTVEYVDQHFAVCSGLTPHPTQTEANASNESLRPTFYSPIYNMSPTSGSPARFSSMGQDSIINDITSTFAPSTSEASDEKFILAAPGYPSIQPPPLPHLTVAHPPTHQYHEKESPLSSFPTVPDDSLAPTSTILPNNARAAADFLEAENSARVQSNPDEEALTFPEDKHVITDYLYFLTQQLQICHFKESDRKVRGGKRDKLTIGYGGLECRHCASRHRSRKFYWTNVERLANSFSEVSTHIIKCDDCPDQIKAALRELKQTHMEQMSKVPRGSQKVFFRRVWRRIHPNEYTVPFSCSLAANASSSSLASSQKMHRFGKEADSHNYTQEQAHCGAHEYFGTRLLATPSDKQWLSDVDCAIRSKLEVFCASPLDVNANLNHYALNDSTTCIRLNQVGLRCVYCASATNTVAGHARVYPSSIHAIYEKVRNFHQSHLCDCPNMPVEERDKLAHLATSTKSLSSISRRYCIKSAKSIGMYDTPYGIFLQHGYPTTTPVEPASAAPAEVEWQVEPRESSGERGFEQDVLSAPAVETSLLGASPGDVETWLSQCHETADDKRKRKGMSPPSQNSDDEGAKPMSKKPTN